MSQTGLAREDVLDLLYQNVSEREMFDTSGTYSLSARGTTMTLRQDGDRVTGTYDFPADQKNGRIEGVIKDRVMSGHWLQASFKPPNDAGSVEFTFAPDGSSFTGKWSNGYGGQWDNTAWNGTRTSAPASVGIIPHKFFINRTLGDNLYLKISLNTTKPKTPYQQIDNLNLGTLDTINRVIRLANKLGWSYSDLDWVLTTLRASDINNDAIIEIAKIARLINQYSLPLDLLSQMWFDIKTTGAGAGTTPFDLIFNNPSVLSPLGGQTYRPKMDAAKESYLNPLYQDPVLPWAVNAGNLTQSIDGDNSPTADELQHANVIVSSIPATTDDVTAIAVKVLGESNLLALDVRNLSALYRHAVLPKTLGMRVSDYLVLLRLLGLFDAKDKTRLSSTLTRDQLLLIAYTVSWMRRAGLSVYDVDYICNATPSPYVDTGYDPNNVSAFLVSLQPLMKQVLLDKDAFQFRDITKEDSEKYYSLLLDNGYIDQYGLVIKDVDEATLKNLLGSKLSSDGLDFIYTKITNQKQAQAAKFAEQLGAFFGVKGATMAALIDGVKLVLNDPNYLEHFISAPLFSVAASRVTTNDGVGLDAAKLTELFAAQTPPIALSTTLQITRQSQDAWRIVDGSNQKTYYALKNSDGNISFSQPLAADLSVVPQPVSVFITAVSRYLRLQRSLNLDIAEIGSIFNYPQAYDIDPRKPGQLTIYNVQRVFRLKQLVNELGDNKDGLVQYLEQFAGSPLPSAAQAATSLHAVTGWEPSQCAYLCQQLFAGACNTVGRISHLKEVFDISKALGVDVFFLGTLSQLKTANATSDNWPNYTEMSAVLLQAVKSQSTAEAWPTQFQQLSSTLNEKKRDALVPVTIGLLNQQGLSLGNSRELYEYLLIDVDMSGCAQISYVKEALNAAQLYLQRSRLSLEPNVKISTDDIPEVYWQWLMNYRVWEANRKIFLYPENYIDPSLRGTKTSLFKDLENTLMQGEVTKERVEEAYRKYLDDFAQLAKLDCVDAYHCTVHDAERGAIDTLFLFARTQTEPYNYYYISREPGDVWSEWKPIDITINASSLTPLYAYDKLFIFWVELKQTKETNGNQKNTVTKATIKYSFYNFNGKWVQPQTLLADQIINVEPGTNPYGPFPPELFHTDELFWHKVAATVASPRNYAGTSQQKSLPEKIIIYYGPLVNALKIPRSPNPYPTVPPTNSDEDAFKATIGIADTRHNHLVDAGQHAELPIMPCVVLNVELENDFLLTPTEYMILTPDQSADTSVPNLAAGIVGTSLLIRPGSYALYHNYLTGTDLVQMSYHAPAKADKTSFADLPGFNESQSEQVFALAQNNAIGLIDPNGSVDSSAVETKTSAYASYLQLSTPAQARAVRNRLFDLFYGTPMLFGNVGQANSTVRAVKNQTGWFLFGESGETFLLEGATYKTKDNVLNVVNGFQTISDALRVTTPFSQVFPDSFIVAGISKATSSSIYTILQSNQLGFIDSNGIVNLGLVQPTKPQTLMTYFQNTVSLEQATLIKAILLNNGPTALGVAPSSFTIDDNIHTLKFKTTRLTTGAIHNLSRKLFTGGLDSLLSLESQQPPVKVTLPFARLKAEGQVIPPDVAFGDQVSFQGPYGNYYWELFFHGPMLVSKLLSRNQQFEEAENWLKYIFDPTVTLNPLTKNSFVTNDITPDISQQAYGLLSNPNIGLIDDGGQVDSSILTTSAQTVGSYVQLTDPYQANEVYSILLNNYLSTPTARYWQFMPFRNNTPESLLDQLNNSTEIAVYNDDPFDPHAIARLRIGAYEKAIVMQYIDNLLGWGDFEFNLYTWESLTTATMLYVYAYSLLGPRPQNLGPCRSGFPVSFADIQAKYAQSPGGIPQFLLELEQLVGDGQGDPGALNQAGTPFNDFDAYFCVPENDQFASYWDRVEDRLYKIRHCLNLAGQKQPLPLFEPPIDPMALVRAAAAGGNVLDVIAHTQMDLPYYRFQHMIERAKAVTGTVVELGNSLLSVLEKSDAEQLSLLRSTHEQVVLNLTTLERQNDIDDLQSQLSALQTNQLNAKYRLDHYKQLIQNGLNAAETANLTLMAAAIYPQYTAIGIRGVSIAGYLLPDIFGFSDGGMQFGDAINMGASIAEGLATILNQSATLASTVGEHQRRAEDWDFQQQLAQYDINEITQQMASVQTRIATSQQALAIHLKTIEQAKEEADFLKSKFSNKDLYQWMIGRISMVYFQSYSLALELALAAQATYHYELDRDDDYITFSYWDSLYKGLLAGEGLMLSLAQLENAYVKNNPRRLELEKTISLRQQFPQDFIAFKQGSKKGQLDFSLSQSLFDFDFPSQYCRKIKSLSISIPAVIGPYQSINATLTQNSNTVVLKPDKQAVKFVLYNGYGKPATRPAVDALRENWVPNQQIALSRGTDDTGLFTLDFNDERYLPFEGTGAVSTWTLSMPPDTNRINYDSIADIIVRVQYTALDGGSDPFGKDVKSLYKGLSDLPQPFLSAKSFNLKTAFPSAWYQMFKTPPVGKSPQIVFQLTDDFILPNIESVKLVSLLVQFEVAGDGAADKTGSYVSFQINGKPDEGVSIPMDLNYFGEIATLPDAVSKPTSPALSSLSFTVANAPTGILKDDKSGLDPTKLENITLILIYTFNPFSSS